MRQVIEAFSAGPYRVTLELFDDIWYVTAEEPGIRQTASFKTYIAALSEFNEDVKYFKELEEFD